MTTQDEMFQEQMRNLRAAATIAEHRDRPDRHDIAEACRWAVSRLTHYYEQERAAAFAPQEAAPMPTIEKGDWITFGFAPGGSVVMVKGEPIAQMFNGRDDITEIRKANGDVWRREPRP